MWHHQRLPSGCGGGYALAAQPFSGQPGGTTGHSHRKRGGAAFYVRMPPHAHARVSPLVLGPTCTRLHALPAAARATGAHAIVVAAALVRVADRVLLRQHGCIALRRRQRRRRRRQRWQRWQWWRRIKSVSYESHISRGLSGDGLPNIQSTASDAWRASIEVGRVSWQRVERSKGKAGTVGPRLAGLPALLHRVETIGIKAPRVAAAGVPAVSDTQSNGSRGSGRCGGRRRRGRR